jgi:site-specific DNA-methyltransferase (adenine-specific)
MENFPLPRLDDDEELKNLLLPYCRLKRGDIWTDTLKQHKVLCDDCTNDLSIKKLMGEEKSTLALHDPPYNFIAFDQRQLDNFIDWSKSWVNTTSFSLADNSSMYIWLGADQKNHFQPLPQFMSMMAATDFCSRSFITMRNQRGYGTQKNWMSIRQELLYYTKGVPSFNVNAEYTDIPKILKGYYKEINGVVTENSERSNSQFIRAGNVWVDVQQVFYRMEENVNGCFAQKPLKAVKRIIQASSSENDIVIDFFSHSGTTLLAAELLNRKCYCADIDPIFCEISIRRIENHRANHKTGWQNSNPFYKEIECNNSLKNYLQKKYSEVKTASLKVNPI